jgi:tRNA (guanine-N7-)-methyltransferase
VSAETTVEHPRKVRSFVRRPGRVTPAQRRALSELAPRYSAGSGTERVDLDAVFGRRAPRVLEIGFGDGEALVTCAVNYPEIDYLGIEVHEPGIGHLLLLLEKTAAPNVRIFTLDAADVVPQALAPRSLDAVNLFIPDPWPKKRHHKPRLVQPPGLTDIERALKPQGLLHVATDWVDYARHCREIITPETGFVDVDAAALVGDPFAFRPPTKFERRGLRLGHDVADLFYRKTV